MLPTNDYPEWQCEECGEKFYADEAKLPPSECPKCKSIKIKENGPFVRRGPFPKNPFKKY